MCLKFAHEKLSSVMNAGLMQDEEVENVQAMNMEKAEVELGVRISRAEAKQREGKEVITACTKLAKIYNSKYGDSDSIIHKSNVENLQQENMKLKNLELVVVLVLLEIGMVVMAEMLVEMVMIPNMK